MNDLLVNYRKLIVWLVALAITYAINKGMPPDIANSFGGILTDLLPTIGAALYSYFNVQAKKTATQTAAAPAGNSTAAAAPAAQIGAPAASPPAEPTDTQEVAPAPPPTPYINPGLDARDNVLNDKQRQAIIELFNRQVTSPPKLPDLPVTESTLSIDKMRDWENRYQTVQNNLTAQALTLFPGTQADTIVKMRDNCDPAIWDRVQYHFREAFIHWVEYGTALWHAKNPMPS